MNPAADFSIKPTLVGSRVTLRPFEPADLAAMARILADPDVRRLTGSVNTTAGAEASSADSGTDDIALDDATRAWYLSRNDQTDRLDLAIVDNSTGDCVGEVVLNEWEPENASCNFRILIGPAGRDRGLGSEATALLLDHAFAATALHRIELEVYAFNPRAQHVYERAGFTLEGRRRDALIFDGQRIDAIGMSMLRTDRA
ncbi:GNAT family N-acetyltransferase [Leifsonia sp. YAF41]|uniref:GNAT family N-acetyltransferase n=1 Tax=Leifsonia sp. YAF41 TaxID=3233086 RepID=UPI003F9E842A